MATITKRGNSYKITVSLGRDMENKEIRKHMTWPIPEGKSNSWIEKEVHRQAVLFEEKCKNGKILDDNMRFSEFIEIWLSNYAEKQLRPKTLYRYKLMLDRIIPALGHQKIGKIQPHHLLAFYSNLEETGVRLDLRYKCKIDLKSLLKKKKMTKTALAKELEISISVLDSITRGKCISKISASAVSNYFNQKMDEMFEAVNGDLTLSSKTILHHHRLLSIIFETAVRWQVIFSNPCDRVRPPKVLPEKAKYYDEVQAVQLLEFLDQEEDTQFIVAIKLLLFSGMRRGELLGLEWSDVDFKNQLIEINRTSLYLPDKGVFTDTTKTTSSQRAIKLPDSVMTMLRQYKTYQTEIRLKCGDEWINNDRLFTTWNGAPMHPDTTSDKFHKFIVKNNLPDISLHSLRHTNATLQIASGVPLPTISKRLGHSFQTTTSKIYVHAIRSAEEAAVEALENILSPTENRANKIQ